MVLVISDFVISVLLRCLIFSQSLKFSLFNFFLVSGAIFNISEIQDSGLFKMYMPRYVGAMRSPVTSDVMWLSLRQPYMPQKFATEVKL